MPAPATPEAKRPTPKPSDADRRAAVAIYDALGIEEASTRTGWSAQAIGRWAAKDEWRSPTPPLMEEIDFTAADWAEHTADLLRKVAVLAASRELQMVPFTDASLANRIRTTAVHDVQLLTGKATERTEATQITEKEALSLADELAARRSHTQRTPLLPEERAG